jgi:glycosyltransferase involved in cell wall biosynthesis
VATHDVDALLVEPGDVEALGEALGRVTTDHALSERLRGTGDVRAEGFAMTSLTDRYVEIYQSLLPSSR